MAAEDGGQVDGAVHWWGWSPGGRRCRGRRRVTFLLDGGDHDVLAALLAAAAFVEHAEGFADARSVAEEDLEAAAAFAALLRLDAAQQFVGIESAIGADGHDYRFRKSRLKALQPGLAAHWGWTSVAGCDIKMQHLTLPSSCRETTSWESKRALPRGRGSDDVVDPTGLQIGAATVRERLARGNRVSRQKLLGSGAWSSARFSWSTLTRGSPRNPNCRPSVLAATSWRTASGAHAARGGDAGDLRFGGFRADVRVEAAARGGHRVGGHRSGEGGILGAELLDVVAGAVGQLLVGGAEVGAAGGEAIVAIVAGGGGAAVEILRAW